MTGILDRMEQSEKLAKQLKQCQTRFCNAQLKASKQLTLKSNAKRDKLVKDFAANKITLKEFVKRTDELAEEQSKALETQNTTACALASCRDQFLNSLKATLESFKYICKKDPQNHNACDVYKRGMALVSRNKTFKVDDYIEYLKVLRSFKMG
jgi:hypothetical protein